MMYIDCLNLVILVPPNDTQKQCHIIKKVHGSKVNNMSTIMLIQEKGKRKPVT